MAGTINDTMINVGMAIEPSTADAITIMQSIYVTPTTTIGLINNDIDPEGVVPANEGSLCVSRATKNLFIKQLGTGNTGWIQLSTAAATAINFVTDIGTAVPDGLNNINFLGEHGINTNGITANTVKIAIDNSIVLGDLSPLLANTDAVRADTGDINVVSGNYKLADTANAFVGSIKIGTERFIHKFGVNNSFVGELAGNYTLTSPAAGDNSSLGYNTLNSLTTGGKNTSVGYTSGQSLTIGGFNTSLGAESLDNSATGSRNIALGYQAGSFISGTESNNIFLGNPGVVADNNTIRIGVQGALAGQQDTCFIAGIIGVTVGSPVNVVIDSVTGQLGVAALSPSSITFVTDSGSAVPDGLNNINIVGSHGINTNATVINTVDIEIDNSIFLGDLAVIAPGSNALTVSTGDIELLLGNVKLPLTTATGLEGVIEAGGSRFIHNFGTNNIFSGIDAGNFSLTVLSSIENSSHGTNTLQSLTTGSNNAAYGYQSGMSLSTGSFNTAVGNSTLVSSSIGTNNIAIGYRSGTIYSLAESSNILINNIGTLGENNTIRIGTQGAGVSQQNRCFIAGIVGVTVASPSNVVIDAAGQLGVAPLTGFTWNTVSITTIALAANNGYVTTSGSLTTATLPLVCALGDTFKIVCEGVGLVRVAQNAGDSIRFTGTTTTVGVGGYIEATDVGDVVEILCIAPNEYFILSSMGSWTIV